MAKKKTTKAPEKNDDWQRGFHEGSLQTLAKEREELMRITQIVEQLMHMHLGSLKELGVDLGQQAKTKKLKGKKPIEDVLS